MIRIHLKLFLTLGVVFLMACDPGEKRSTSVAPTKRQPGTTTGTTGGGKPTAQTSALPGGIVGYDSLNTTLKTFFEPYGVQGDLGTIGIDPFSSNSNGTGIKIRAKALMSNGNFNCFGQNNGDFATGSEGLIMEFWDDKGLVDGNIYILRFNLVKGQVFSQPNEYGETVELVFSDDKNQIVLYGRYDQNNFYGFVEFFTEGADQSVGIPLGKFFLNTTDTFRCGVN